MITREQQQLECDKVDRECEALERKIAAYYKGIVAKLTVQANAIAKRENDKLNNKLDTRIGIIFIVTVALVVISKYIMPAVVTYGLAIVGFVAFGYTMGQMVALQKVKKIFHDAYIQCDNARDKSRDYSEDSID